MRWRWVPAVAIGLLALAGCAAPAAPVEVPLEVEEPVDEVTPTPEPPSGHSYRAEITTTQGYTFELMWQIDDDVTAHTDITQALPGNTEIFIQASSHVTLTNTTSGREAPAPEINRPEFGFLTSFGTPLCSGDHGSLNRALPGGNGEYLPFCGISASGNLGGGTFGVGESRSYDIAIDFSTEIPEEDGAATVADLSGDEKTWFISFQHRTETLFLYDYNDVGRCWFPGGGLVNQIVWASAAIPACEVAAIGDR